MLGPEADQTVRRLDDIHRRRPQEAGHEGVGRLGVDLDRRAELPDSPALHDGDPVPEAHGLDLVVGDVDGGRTDAPLELLELVACRGTELRVQVGEWLVEQEYRWLADDGPGQRHALALAARELARLAVEQVTDPEERGRPLDSLGDLLPAHALGFEGEGDVLQHGHVRVERVALEDHRDLPGARRQVVDDLATDEDLPRGRRFEPGDHSEQRGLAAARRPEEDEELALLGREIHSVDRADVAEVLADRSRLYRGQIKPAPSPSTCRRCAGRPCRLP